MGIRGLQHLQQWNGRRLLGSHPQPELRQRLHDCVRKLHNLVAKRWATDQIFHFFGLEVDMHVFSFSISLSCSPHQGKGYKRTNGSEWSYTWPQNTLYRTLSMDLHILVCVPYPTSPLPHRMNGWSGRGAAFLVWMCPLARRVSSCLLDNGFSFQHHLLEPGGQLLPWSAIWQRWIDDCRGALEWQLCGGVPNLDHRSPLHHLEMGKMICLQFKSHS